ncbi:hypothetical protein [Pedobacter frigidisoli]|uniref:hypothetical protein n=1 Tax=Pedobacter frigidisoli TaxID=2530455 RepID=UPI00292F394B|nr:hypothetical protein [Pedobacter frigidisoli]
MNITKPVFLFLLLISLGILVFEGEYLSTQYNQTLRKVEFNRFQIKSLKGSAESLLNQPGRKFYFLDFKNLKESDPFKILLTRKNLTYNSNGGYIINSFRGKNVYAKGILPKLFDGVFFIKESTPIHLID